MDRYRLGRLHRKLRQRAHKTQREHAATCGVSPRVVMRLEAGDIERLSVGDVIGLFSALGADVDILARYRGAAADRLLDELHARLVGQAVEVLHDYEWVSHLEVSYSSFGDRGSIDVIAYHPQRRALCVIEVKSELGAIEGTLRPLDVKARLAAEIGRERFGWRPVTIGRILILPEQRTARRQVERHGAVLGAALPMRSRALRTWLRDPVGGIAGIWFLTERQGSGERRNPSAVQRVRKSPPLRAA